MQKRHRGRLEQQVVIMPDFVNIEQQEAGFVPFGTEFVNPDFSKVAEACGARGIRIEEPGDVLEGLQTALAHKDGPVVVDVLVLVDRYALSLPSHMRDVEGLHPESVKAGANREDGRSHRDARAQHRVGLTVSEARSDVRCQEKTSGRIDRIS